MKIAIVCAAKMKGSFVEESRISCAAVLKAYTSRCEKINGMLKGKGWNGMLKVKGCNLQSHHGEQPPPSFTCAPSPRRHGLNVINRSKLITDLILISCLHKGGGLMIIIFSPFFVVVVACYQVWRMVFKLSLHHLQKAQACVWRWRVGLPDLFEVMSPSLKTMLL